MMPLKFPKDLSFALVESAERLSKVVDERDVLMAQLVELQEENARLREDAERYRWLYKTTGASSGGFHNVYLTLPANWYRGSIAQHWEEAIDAAMSSNRT